MITQHWKFLILQDNNINSCEFYEACDIRINKKDDDNEK